MERIKRGNLRVDEINKNKRRKLKYIIIALVILVLLLVAVFIIIRINSRSYNAFKTKNSVELVSTNAGPILKYKSGILRTTRDGAETVSSDGKQVWNVSYNMKNPVADVNGNYAVIADLGGKTASIVNGSGVSNTVETLYPIMEAQVSQQGVAALLLDKGTQDCVSIYSMEKTQPLLDVNTIATSDGFPISIALSDDGRKLITSYIKVENDTTISQVSFYNFGDVGDNYIDQLVGSWSFTSFVPKVEFISNNVVAIFLEDGLYLYSMAEVPNEIAKITYTERIKDVFYTSSYIGVILEHEDGNKADQIIMYNLNGKQTMKGEINFSYTSVAAGEEYLVFYNDLSCTVLNLKGKEIFTDTFPIAIKSMFQGRNAKEFFTVTDIGLNTLEMVETKEE